MSECEGCNFWFEDNDRQQPCCGARGGKYLEDIKEPCHLTPDHQRFINAMTRGVWECETCDAREEGGVYCLVHSINMVHPCFDWQERKEGEDGS